MGQENLMIQEVKDNGKVSILLRRRSFLPLKRTVKKLVLPPPPKPPTQLIEIFESTPTFSGLRGLETCDDKGAGR